MPKVPRNCRRSRRLENISPTSSIGNFNSLPVEIFHLVLSYLSVGDLSRLAITTKMMRGVVDNFVRSPAGMKIALPFCLSEEKSPADATMKVNHFHRLGIFVKRSTCLYATKIRLEMVEEFILQLTCTSGKNCRCLHKNIALNYFGKFLHIVIAGWDESELSVVFNKIQTKSKINKYQQIVLKSAPGFMFNLENILRVFYRYIYFEPEVRPDMRGFWLFTLLHPLPIVHQARLLINIFGPVQEERIQWTSPVEDIAENAVEAELHYNNLAQALKILHRHKDRLGAVLSIIEEIIELPLDWLPENVATLLYLCGDKICVAYLANKAHNGHYNELSILLTCLTLVSQKFGNDINYVTGVICRICTVISNKTGKIKLWSSIADSFRHTIIDILQYHNMENEDPNLLSLLDAFTHLFKHNLRQNLT